MNTGKKWYQQKTTWAGIGLLVTAASAYFCSDDPNITEIVTIALNGLAAIFLRQAVNGGTAK